jgi:hypothetical protein
MNVGVPFPCRFFLKHTCSTGTPVLPETKRCFSLPCHTSVSCLVLPCTQQTLSNVSSVSSRTPGLPCQRYRSSLCFCCPRPRRPSTLMNARQHPHHVLFIHCLPVVGKDVDSLHVVVRGRLRLHLPRPPFGLFTGSTSTCQTTRPIGVHSSVFHTLVFILQCSHLGVYERQ